MAEEKQHKDVAPSKGIEETGKGEINDEMLPDRGAPVEQGGTEEGGDVSDTAGEHGDMAPEGARSVDKKAKEEHGR